MSTWVDPNLLSLVGLGIQSDPDVPDGRHLRWFMGAPIGFPRSGFHLRRHPSRATASWDALPADPLIRETGLTQPDLGTGPSRRFDSGLTVAKAEWLAYTATTPNVAPMLRIDEHPVTFDFGIAGPGSPPFPPTPMLSNPAAFVRLTILRRRRTGFAIATGAYDARGSYIEQDRGGVGTKRPGWFPDHLDDIVVTANGLRLRSAAERLLDAATLESADHGARTALERLGRVRRDVRHPPVHPLDPNAWVTETLLLRGGWVDHVEVTGRDAVVARIQWISVREYAGSPAWVDVGRFYLPITDASELYPAWTPQPASQVVKDRLMLASPRRNVPWDDPAQAVATNLARRYLHEHFESIDEAMRLFLKGQVTSVIPQAMVEVEQTLDATGPVDADSVTARVRPFEHVYAAAADPQNARMLGLMTTDTVDPAGTYDYCLDVAVAPLWIQWALFPEEAELASKELRERGIDGGAGLEQDRRPDVCLAMVTALRMTPAATPSAPEDMRARVDPDILRRPVQASVELSWRAESMTNFAADARARVFYALSRSASGGDALLHHKDDESGLLLPHLPTQRQPSDGRLRLVDNGLPAWGLYTWRVRGMDLWGRFSPDAAVTTEVQDTIPPPAPSAVAGALVGDAGSAPTWTSVTIAFDWTAAQAALAQDLDRFEIHLRQGAVDRAVESDESTWGRFEQSPTVSSPPLVVRWPALILENVPAGLAGEEDASVIAEEDGGGLHVEIRVGPLQVPFGGDHRAIVSATVRAIDTFGNAGSFGAHARAVRFDESIPAVPPMPTDIVLASRPDAAGVSTYAFTWPDLGDGHVRVLRSSAARLLAGTEFDVAAFDALDRGVQAGQLRALALANPALFTADHEYPYSARPGSHLAALSARERGLTIFTLEPTSSTGVRAPWPTDPSAFAVVAVPRVRVPEVPFVREVRGGDCSVTLSIVSVPAGDVQRLRIYRARQADDARDLRRMRLVAERSPEPGADTTVEDTGLYADIDYWYRVVAIAEDGTASPPSAPTLVRPFTMAPPPAPVILAVVRTATTPTRRVTAVVPRRDFTLVLLRRRVALVEWHTAEGPHIGTNGLVNVMALSPVPVAGGYEIAIDDEVPSDPDERYVYRLRLRDPRGRTAESVPVQEAP